MQYIAGIVFVENRQRLTNRQILDGRTVRVTRMQPELLRTYKMRSIEGHAG